MNQIKSAKGTVTWVDPEYYVSFNNETGEIMSIGSPDTTYQILQIEKDLAVKFIDGRLDKLKYRVVKQNDQLVIKQTENITPVFKTYPVLIKETPFPLITVTRDTKNKYWTIEKSVTDPVFFFIFEKNTSNYIRTISVTDEKTVINFEYSSESLAVDIKVNEKYIDTNFKDE